MELVHEAKEMGNSAAVVEESYAAYIRPAALSASLQGKVANGGHAQDPQPLSEGLRGNVPLRIETLEGLALPTS